MSDKHGICSAVLLALGMRPSAEFEIFREMELDEEVIGRIVSAQREELEREIAGLNAEAEKAAEEARELVGEAPF